MKSTNVKIGFFDSGLGGLTILKEAVRQLPEYAYLYLGDNLNAPYGDKTAPEIFAHTLAGVEWLFAQEAKLVVLACNTASAVALRKIQQEILPIKYPNKKLLGIIIPTAEEAEKFSRTKHIGILATSMTVRSGVFEKELAKQNSAMQITCQAGGRLVEMIETDAGAEELEKEIRKTINELLNRDQKIDVIILGCTHYALIAEEIKKCLPATITIINEAPLVVAKLKAYLVNHPEVSCKISQNSAVALYSSSDDEKTKKLMQAFYGEKIEIKGYN